MSDRWVVNASPLILLGKIDQTRLLRDLSDELIIPESVARQVSHGRIPGRRQDLLIARRPVEEALIARVEGVVADG